jgi:hypothetical protein
MIWLYSAHFSPGVEKIPAIPSIQVIHSLEEWNIRQKNTPAILHGNILADN